MKKMIKIWLDDTQEHVLSRHKNGRYYYGVRNIKTNETKVEELTKKEFYNLMDAWDVLMNRVVDEGGNEE